MTRFLAPSAPALRDATPRILSACLFHFDGAGASLDSVCGRTGTFTRAGTLASVSDGVGTTYTAPHSHPAWESRDWDGNGTRESCGLRMDSASFLTWPSPPIPQAMSGLLEFIETGGVSTANATLFAIANDALSGALLWIGTSGTYYQAVWTDGATTRTATLGAAPVTGNRVQLRWSIESDGVLTLRQSINNAAGTTATAAALALPTAWGTGAVVRLNARGDTENPAQGWYRRAKLVSGIVEPAMLDAVR